jgi:hypothetical protein
MTAFTPGMYSFPLPHFLWIPAVALGVLLLFRVLYRLVGLPAALITSLLVLAGTNYFHELFFGSVDETAWLFFLYLAVIGLSFGKKHTPGWLTLLIIAPITWLIFRLRPEGIFILLFPLMALLLQPGTGERKPMSFKEEGLKTGYLVMVVFSCFFLWHFSFFTSRMGLYSLGRFAGIHFLWAPVHIHEVLFSIKSGWLVYTPVVVIAFAGYYFLAERNRPLYLASFLFVLTGLLSVSTRWLPWHDRSPGNPELVSTWAALCLPLGFFVGWMWNRGKAARMALLAGSVVLAALNLFQTWQFQRRIIVPERMTAAYYCAVFGKASVTAGDSLLMEPPLTGHVDSIPQGLKITCRTLETFGFETPDPGYGTSVAGRAMHSGRYGLVLNPQRQYSPGLLAPVGSLSDRDSCWIRAEGYVYCNDPGGMAGFLVVTCLRDGKPFKYSVTDLQGPNFEPGRWNRAAMTYRVPFPAAPGDMLQVYFMNYGKKEFFVDVITIELCKAGH